MKKIALAGALGGLLACEPHVVLAPIEYSPPVVAAQRRQLACVFRTAANELARDLESRDQPGGYSYLAILLHGVDSFSDAQPAPCVTTSVNVRHGLWLDSIFTSTGNSVHNDQLGYATILSPGGFLAMHRYAIRTPVDLDTMCITRPFPGVACDQAIERSAGGRRYTDWRVCFDQVDTTEVCYRSKNNHVSCGFTPVCNAARADHMTGITCNAANTQLCTR